MVLVKSALARGISFFEMQEKSIQKTGVSSITNLGFFTQQFFVFSGGLEALGAEYGISENLDAATPPM